jgi:pimeloyl-ACP methyl ester carboxylesterase
MASVAPAGVEAEMIDVAGTPVAVRRRGVGAPLLFLHGGGFTGLWTVFLEELSTGAEVWAPDHIGFGATPAQEWMTGVDDLVLHYEDLRRTAGWEQVDLVGYSLGGWIAAAYATVYPERVRRLALITPIGLRVPGKPIGDVMMMTPQTLYGTIFNDPTNIPQVAPDANNLDVIVHIYEEMTTLARLLWNPRHDPKLPRRLRRIESPTLVVGAENDRLVPDEMCDLYAELITGARVERVPGTGHALIIEQPERCARLVLDHIGQRGRTR